LCPMHMRDVLRSFVASYVASGTGSRRGSMLKSNVKSVVHCLQHGENLQAVKDFAQPSVVKGFIMWLSTARNIRRENYPVRCVGRLFTLTDKNKKPACPLADRCLAKFIRDFLELAVAKGFWRNMADLLSGLPDLPTLGTRIWRFCPRLLVPLKSTVFSCATTYPSCYLIRDAHLSVCISAGPCLGI